MKSTHPFAYVASALGALVVLGSGPNALASSHREAPAIANDPSADNTDIWAWVTPGSHDKLTVIANYIPLEEPSSGPNFFHFSDDVLYEIHITRGTQSLDDAFTYRIQFHTTPVQRVDPTNLSLPVGGGKEFFAQLTGQSQTYTVTKAVGGDWDHATVVAKNVPVAPWNVGPRTNTVAYKIPAYDDAFAATFVQPTTEKGRTFVGPRDDGFYADLGGIFDLANLRPAGVAMDGLAGYNVESIAIEIPTANLTGPNPSQENALLGVWCSASRQKIAITARDGKDQAAGPWVQVSRLGLPLINEAIVGVQDKDRYNRSVPATDVANFGQYFLNPVLVRDAEAVGIYSALGVPQSTVDALKSNRTDILDAINLKSLGYNIPLSATGDVLRVATNVDSKFPNGRQIPGAGPNQEQVDVTDALLTLIVSGGAIPVSDGVNHNDTNFLTTFPWQALPWEGFSQGHGKVAQ
ncbi:MAG TPA: DUF4331 domain-containing protein [Polyangiaceae bacterium]|jgi:hypothetical protein|nr:DUF4331 domain-containing protein [Polyangiaceae bacterium]